MNGCVRQDLTPAQLPAACAALLRNGGRMQFAYAWFPAPGAAELRYVAAPGADQPFTAWRVPVAPGGEVPSLANAAPLLGWYEREIMDLCGLRFADHPEPEPLVLHDGARPARPPLELSDAADAPLPFATRPSRLPELRTRQGLREVQLLPFGPVRGDVLESARFAFMYLGEAIIYYQPQLFFKHRGMERRFQGLSPALGTVLAERVSGVGSVCHALAYCQAVEAACGCTPPPRAQALRVLLAEIERLYNHLHYLGHLCHTTTLKVGEAEGKLLEERAKQLFARLTGSRFGRGLLWPGGLRRDVAIAPEMSGEVEALRGQALRYGRMLCATNSHLDRLLTTGLLERQVAFDQGATGPVERASGIDRDLRRDHPYARYPGLPLAVPVRSEGDAHARMRVRLDELEASFALVQYGLSDAPAGAVRVPCVPVPSAEGLGWAEGPRGSLFYAVHLDATGRLARVKIKSPSFSNWRVFPSTVHDSNMMDYAINEASFGLTIAGCDR
jgi:Ni,Fe-hydrogenase III large subunit